MIKPYRTKADAENPAAAMLRTRHRPPTRWTVSQRVPFSLMCEGEEAWIDIDVKVRHYVGCDDWYDSRIGGPGGWQPGDAPETELIEAKVNGEDVPGWMWSKLYELDWRELVDLSPPEQPED